MPPKSYTESADFAGSSTNLAPPNHPPPPSVPEGWAVRWDNTYKRFYYVNKATRASQWEPPEGTVFKDDPPSYSSVVSPPRTPARTPVPEIQRPQSAPHHSSPELATASSSSHSQRPRGLLGKLGNYLEKKQAQSAARHNALYRPHPMMGTQSYIVSSGPGFRPVGGMMGGSMMGRPMGHYGYGYPARRRGLGAGSAGALGLGGGLLGGMMMADAMNDNYAEGFQDGMSADDFGGGDFGGGDFDMGGMDF